MRKQHRKSPKVPEERIALLVRLPASMVKQLDACLSGPRLRNRFLVEALEQVRTTEFIEEYGNRRGVMLRLPKQLHERLARIARCTGCSIAQIVAKVISQHLGK